MAMELCYTSAPRGLAPGSRGFCTVAATAGMPAPLIERLESFSGYRPLGDARDGDPADHPVNWAHRQITIGGQVYSVLSRIGFAGADYTQRSNKLAHHVALREDERPPAGPAWVLQHGGLMRAAWRDEPRLIPEELHVPPGDAEPAICRAWADATGDAGWAGVLAEWFVLDRSRPAYVIYRPGSVDPLALAAEAIALLSPALRWQVNFSTYFTDLPAGTTCHWRFVVAGTPAAQQAMQTKQEVLRIDLDHAGPCTRDGHFIRLARTGEATDPQSAEPAATAEPYALSEAPPTPARTPANRVRIRAHSASARPSERPAATASVEPRRRSLLPWLVVAATIPVLAAGMWWVRPGDRSLQLAAQLEALQAELASRDAEIANLRSQLEALQQAPAPPRPEPIPTAPATATHDAAADAAPPAAPASSPEPAVAAPAPPFPPRPTAPSGDRITPGPGVAAVDAIVSRYAVELPSGDRPAAPLLNGLPAGASLAFSPPGKGAAPPLRFVSAAGVVTLLLESADALGMRESQPVMTASLNGDSLQWSWSPESLPLELRRSQAAERMMRYGLLVVSDSEGQTVAEVQFLRPQAATLRIDQAVWIDRAWTGAEPRLLVLSTPSPWRAIPRAGAGTGADPRRATLRSPAGAAIELALLPRSDGERAQFSAVWADGCAPAELRSRIELLRSRTEQRRATVAAYDVAQAEIDAARAALPQRDDGGIDINAAQKPAHRAAWTRYTNARQRLDELRAQSPDTDLAALSAQHAEDLADLLQAEARLRDVEAAVPFECLVVADRSETLLARLEVRP